MAVLSQLLDRRRRAASLRAAYVRPVPSPESQGLSGTSSKDGLPWPRARGLPALMFSLTHHRHAGRVGLGQDPRRCRSVLLASLVRRFVRAAQSPLCPLRAGTRSCPVQPQQGLARLRRLLRQHRTIRRSPRRSVRLRQYRASLRAMRRASRHAQPSRRRRPHLMRSRRPTRCRPPRAHRVLESPGAIPLSRISGRPFLLSLATPQRDLPRYRLARRRE